MRKVNDSYEPVESGYSPKPRYLGLAVVGLVVVASLFWWIRLRE